MDSEDDAEDTMLKSEETVPWTSSAYATTLSRGKYQWCVFSNLSSS